MKYAAALIALSIATAASAQTAPAPAPTPATPAAPAIGAKYTLDTPLADLVADPAAKAVLDKDLPGLTTLDGFDSFKGASLNQVVPFSNGALIPEKLAQVAADLAAIK
ncbi:hypothetical protein G4G27_20760 [Sphingomonas sp. So64.6b]|uniref:hypothetical protein n=1 Tax=Sphingomonas sp. So64.6b TaxID=2997354 RepID=UPI001600E6F5|nr:hypothetical protein [Sphingomonas sp. So64.6b]QNA86141.1 hypothetical protein G4G27_20760 [Sphingomonas sp. So64.6b]